MSKRTVIILLSFCVATVFIELMARTVIYQRGNGAPSAVVELAKQAWQNVAPHPAPSEKKPWLNYVDLPEDVRQELISSNAIISNAANPTNAEQHDTILVKPDNGRRYVLRPNTDITGLLLKAASPFNIDPPVLYYPTSTVFSKRVSSWISNNSRGLIWSYHIGANGLRRTLPVVNAPRKILVVGDSVGFGVGVNDRDTIASHMQRIIGDGTQVINASVGGYQGPEIVETARLMMSNGPYDALVYIACANDFMTSLDDMEPTIKGLAKLKEHYKRVHVVLTPYLEYVAQDLFDWPEYLLKNNDKIREDLPEIVARYGLSYTDWTYAVIASTRENYSIFHRLAYYVDHTHLSPYGAENIAQGIIQALSY